MSDIADKLIDTAYVVDGMLIQRDNLLRPIPTLMRDAAIDIRDLEAENAKLREAVDYLYGFAKTYGVSADDLRELGVEVDDGRVRS